MWHWLVIITNNYSFNVDDFSVLSGCFNKTAKQWKCSKYKFYKTVLCNHGASIRADFYFTFKRNQKLLCMSHRSPFPSSKKKYLDFMSLRYSLVLSPRRMILSHSTTWFRAWSTYRVYWSEATYPQRNWNWGRVMRVCAEKALHYSLWRTQHTDRGTAV